ncbi:MAG TPA: hypothetical protein VMZ28_31395 [Kofleriaceae bacterium]|nr:hypothetical protein [Kofleriaceae bacterium]
MRAITTVLILALVVSGCAKQLERKLVKPEQVQTLDHESPYLKVHMKDGGLYVLSEWSVDEARGVVIGVGDRFDARREVVSTGTAEVAVADVALFETNVVVTSDVMGAVAVVAGISLAVTVACLSNPKACFGSCPTFYLAADGGGELLQAEGFSASVAPSLEERDVDHLYRARVSGRDLVVRLTNEAYETHVIRYARIIAATPPPGGRVLATPDGALLAATRLAPPTTCAAAEGDCLAAVRAMDARERSSRTDGNDLATREKIELTFEPAAAAGEERGLVIGARQTFLTTYLFYQMLSYLGRSAGAVLAELERRGGRLGDGAIDMRTVLGGIRIEAERADGTFAPVGEFDETGPLAADVQVFRLPRGAGPRVRLTVTRGHYRLDLVAMATLAGAARSVELEPVAVERGGVADADALARLRGGAEQLVTRPGDELHVRYRLPEGASELFLASRGYYLEWMRQEWLREESPLRAALFLRQPRLALRLLAPAFRAVEDRMEEMFWRSRYSPAHQKKPSAGMTSGARSASPRGGASAR